METPLWIIAICCTIYVGSLTIRHALVWYLHRTRYHRNWIKRSLNYVLNGSYE